MRPLAVVAAASLLACNREKPEHVYPPSDSGAPAVEWGAPGLVRINEVRGDDPAAVELHNTSPSATVDLAGWTVRVGDDCEATLGQTAQLGPGGFLLLWDDSNLHCGIDDNGTITLLGADGAIVDQVDWTVPFARHSWCRIPDGTGAFTVCSRFSPGNPNNDREPANQVSPSWTWSYGERAEALATAPGGGVWVGQPNGGQLTLLATTDGSSQRDLDLNSLPAGTLEDPGWRGLATLDDGRVAIASTHNAEVLALDPASGATTVLLDTSAQGDPSFVHEGHDGTLFVTFQAADRVVAYTPEGTVLWQADASADLPLHGPTGLTPMHDYLVVLADTDRILTVLDPASGGLVGTISGPESDDASDVETGRVASEVIGLAWSATHDVLFLSELRTGRMKGFDTSDLDVLFDPALSWGYLGAAGWFGNEPDELGAPWVMAVTDDDMLMLVDVGNQRVGGYVLSDVVAHLTP